MVELVKIDAVLCRIWGYMVCSGDEEDGEEREIGIVGARRCGIQDPAPTPRWA